MKPRFIQSMRIVALFLGTLFGGKTAEEKKSFEDAPEKSSIRIRKKQIISFRLSPPAALM